MRDLGNNKIAHSESGLLVDLDLQEALRLKDFPTLFIADFLSKTKALDLQRTLLPRILSTQADFSRGLSQVFCGEDLIELPTHLEALVALASPLLNSEAVVLPL